MAYYTDPKTQKETQYILEAKTLKLTENQNVFKAIEKPSMLVPYQDSGGNESLWAVKLAGKGQTTMVSHTTSLELLRYASRLALCLF